MMLLGTSVKGTLPEPRDRRRRGQRRRGNWWSRREGRDDGVDTSGCDGRNQTGSYRSDHWRPVSERQLLSFARAIVGDPRILILDEATANIDAPMEILIQRALRKVLKDRISIVIDHRLSTIRNADKIVMFDQGRVAEIGNHQELLQNNGVYSRLHAVNYGTG